jgi:hypothetical protein
MTDKRPLAAQFEQKGPYQVIRLLDDDPGSRGDLSELISMIEQCIRDGRLTVAVVFTRSALLYTRSIAALVRCYALLDDAHGAFSVVAPNPHLLRSIQVAGIDTIIKTYAAEADLPGIA